MAHYRLHPSDGGGRGPYRGLSKREVLLNVGISSGELEAIMGGCAKNFRFHGATVVIKQSFRREVRFDAPKFGRRRGDWCIWLPDGSARSRESVASKRGTKISWSIFMVREHMQPPVTPQVSNTPIP